MALEVLASRIAAVAKSRVLRVVAFVAFGGILFGLDQGNWAGAVIKPGFVENFCWGGEDPWGTEEACTSKETKLKPSEFTNFLGVGSALVQAGAAVAQLSMAPVMARSCGRRETLFFGAIVAIVGNLGQCATTNVTLFLIFRFLDGIGVGCVTFAVPMYMSEIAPASIRGACGSSMQLTMVFGMVIAAVLNSFPWFGYRISFALPVFPAVLLAAGILFMPISPLYALIKGDVDRAKASLMTLRDDNKEEVETEVAELQESLAAASNEAPWSALWKVPSVRKRVLVANALQWLQQMSGVNALLSFGPNIFLDAGLEMDPLIANMLVSIFNLVFTIIMMKLVDRQGRRSLLLVSGAGMFVAMSGAAYFANVIKHAEGDVPSHLGILLLMSTLAFISSFAMGWGSLPWVYPAEIFPSDVKEKAIATSGCSQWVANCLIAYIVPIQVAQWGSDWTFAFYAVWLGITIVFVYLCVPETKGLSVEQIGALFGEGQARDAEMARHFHGESEACYAACSLDNLQELANYAAKRASRASSSASAVELSVRAEGEAPAAAEPRAPQAEVAPQDAEPSADEARPLRKASSRIRISAGGSVAVA